MCENINQKERRRILELSSPQSSGRSKVKSRLTPVRKIKSRVTSGLNNRSFEQNNFTECEIDSNMATISSDFEESSFSFFQNVNITVIYYLDDVSVEKMEILVSEDKTIEEFIKICLANINSKLIKENKDFQLDTKNLNKYSIRIVKKNEKPNFDLPKFHNLTTIQNMQEDKVCLVWDDKSVIIHSISSQEKPVKKHKKKDMKDPTIKKYIINKPNNEKLNDSCVIY